MEFARQVIAGPDRVPVHADRRRAAGSADASAPEAAAQRVMPQLPGADPAHHRKHQCPAGGKQARSEEHTSELQSLMRISYAVFCLQKKTHTHTHPNTKKTNPLTYQP